MIGGFGRTSGLALLAAAGLFAGSMSAQAADLGGDCCADLEERVAELEATTARKGNRKVKLTVSGWVNEAITYWDDGIESNVYQVTNMVAQTRFRFVGDAKINSDWSAGYLLEIGTGGVRSDGVDHTNDDLTSAGLAVRHSAWWLQSKQLGKVWVGQTSSATDAITEINLANVGHFEGQNAAAMVGGFRVGNVGPRLNVFMGGPANSVSTAGTDPAQIGEGNRNNVVKYETPTVAGFIASASWGEDDMWDVALRYAGEFSGFKIAAGVGYQSWKDGNNDERACTAGSPTDRDCQQLGASGAIMHVPTGLFVHGVYGIRWDDNIAAALDDTSTQWLVMAGIEQKFFPLGKTTIYGVYQQWDIGGTVGMTGNGFVSGEMNSWGLGVNQQIEAAAMDLYLQYRQYDAEGTNANNVTTSFDKFHQLTVGGRIQF